MGNPNNIGIAITDIQGDDEGEEEKKDGEDENQEMVVQPRLLGELPVLKIRNQSQSQRSNRSIGENDTTNSNSWGGLSSLEDEDLDKRDEGWEVESKMEEVVLEVKDGREEVLEEEGNDMLDYPQPPSEMDMMNELDSNPYLIHYNMSENDKS